MNQSKLFRLSIRMYSKWNLQYTPKSAGRLAVRRWLVNNSSYKFYTDTTPKDDTKGKEEKVGSVKMPGFVHPETLNEEGYFTQKARQQLEELKKRLEKPTVENTEKKE